MPTDDRNFERTIRAFADHNRLSISRDVDRTSVIRGRAGCHLYEHDEGELGLLVLREGQDPRPRRWAAIREKCLAAGMTLRQNGHDEGSVTFDPDNRQQSRLAIKIAGARPKRQLSPEHRAKLLAVGFQKRSNATLERASIDKKPLETAEIR
jgi:hypothetical protein